MVEGNMTSAMLRVGLEGVGWGDRMVVKGNMTSGLLRVGLEGEGWGGVGWSGGVKDEVTSGILLGHVRHGSYWLLPFCMML